jgi:hypothetical protein
LNGFDYAHDTGRDVWEFSVAVVELTKLGAFPIDLRWLICKGYAEHADEIILPRAGRRFRRSSTLAFANAVRNCLAICLAAESPVARLVQFVDEIRVDQGWTNEEIREVEARVQRLLFMFANEKRL